MSKERLTIYGGNGEHYESINPIDTPYEYGKINLQRLIDKTAYYEDLEEQGLLLRLPVAVGGAIWVLDRDGKPREMILDEPDIRCHCAKEDNLCMGLCDRKNTGVCAYRFKNDGSDIGEKVFLTQSEAEEKLRELEGK